MIIGALILLVGFFIGYMSRDRRCKEPHQIDFDAQKYTNEKLQQERDSYIDPVKKQAAEFLNDNRVAEITKKKKNVTLDDVLV